MLLWVFFPLQSSKTENKGFLPLILGEIKISPLLSWICFLTAEPAQTKSLQVLTRDFLSGPQDAAPQHLGLALRSSGAPLQPGSPEKIISYLQFYIDAFPFLNQEDY